jgi:hypothetical protein
MEVVDWRKSKFGTIVDFQDSVPGGYRRKNARRPIGGAGVVVLGRRAKLPTGRRIYGREERLTIGVVRPKRHNFEEEREKGKAGSIFMCLLST